MGKGRVRMAKAKAEMLHNQIEQDQIDYRHAVYTLIEQFYNQRNQCAVARKAREVADRRYAIAMENFRRGTISVTEMNTAQNRKGRSQPDLRLGYGRLLELLLLAAPQNALRLHFAHRYQRRIR